MASSETSIRSVGLDDLERQMRALPIPKRSEDRLAELARMVGWKVGGVLGGRQQDTPAPTVQTSVHESFFADEPRADDGLAQESKASVDQALEGDGVASIPETPDAALVRNPSKERSHSLSRTLALVVPLILVVVGIGVALMMRAAPISGLGSKASVVEAPHAPMQAQVAAGGQTPWPSALEGAGSSATPNVVVAKGNAAPPRAAVIPAAMTMPVVAADVSLPDPPQLAAESSVFGTPHRVATVSVTADATIASKGKAEAAPLPPTKPRTLALADATAVKVAPAARKVTPAAPKGVGIIPAKQSDASAKGSGPSSFSIQLASSLSENEAVATLSRLKKQFPDLLGGGSVRRATDNVNGVFYRVQAGPLSRDAAEGACSRLKASGENCIVVRS